jgi:hypothetical protein
MKKFSLLYLFALLTLVGFPSCNKDDDDPQPDPIQGRWILNRVILSDFTGPYSGANGRSFSPSFIYRNSEDFNFISTIIEIESDNKIVYRNDNGVAVDVRPGKWTFTNNNLSLQYNDGGTETYTYDNTTYELVGTAIATTLGYQASENDPVQNIPGKAQLIFIKQ